MSDLPISGLLDGSSALGGDQIAIARGGVSYELTLTEVQSFVLGSLPTDVSTNTTNITALQNDRLKLDGSNGPMTGNLDMGANEISTTTNPSTDDMLTRRGWINSNFLNLAGGTMTGAIILHSTGTPSNGAEPISYTFAEATYAKASGANGYIARFTPDGQTLNVSTLRDNGTVASVNDAVDVNSQFSISTSLYKGLRVVQTGTGSTKHGIDIEMTGANNSEGRGIYSRVTSTGTGFAKGMDLLTTSATGNVTGIHNEAWTTGAVSLGKAMQLGLTAGNGSTITSGYQLYLEGVGQSGTGAVTTAYHMYLAAHSAGTTKWGIYQAGANDINYFNGRVGLGTSTISASTQLKIVPANKYGIHVDSDQNTGSTINGIIVDIANTGTGDIEAIYGVSGGTNDAAADTTLFYSAGVTGGTQANSYGLYLAAHGAGTNKWGIYQDGSLDFNRFNGNTAFNQNVASNRQVSITKDSGETGHSDALFARNDTSTNTTDSSWATAVHGRSVFLSGAPTAGTYAAGRFTFGTELTTNSDTEGAAVIAQVSTYNASNALQNLYGFYLHDFKIDSGHTITGNSYGLYLKGVYGSGAVSGSKYGIYQEGANDDNYFAAATGIGTAPVGNQRLAVLGDASDINGIRVDMNAAGVTSNNAAIWGQNNNDDTTGSQHQFGVAGVMQAMTPDTSGMYASVYGGYGGYSNNALHAGVYGWAAQLGTETNIFGVIGHIRSGNQGTAINGSLQGVANFTGWVKGVNGNITIDNASDSIGGNAYGGYLTAEFSNGTFSSNLYGLYARTRHAKSGVTLGATYTIEAASLVASGSTVTDLYGLKSTLDVDGTATSGYGFYSDTFPSAGTITSYYAFYSKGAETASVTHAHGLYLAAHTVGTNKWGVYQNGSNDNNYFAGQVLVGSTDNDLGSNNGVQINGTEVTSGTNKKASLRIDSQSRANATIALNVNSSCTGTSSIDQNSVISFQEDSTTEWILGMNGTASSAVTARSLAKEFVISHGDTFDQVADRMIVLQPSTPSATAPKTLMGIGAEPNPGSVLTLGTTGAETEIIAASTTGTASTRNGWIQVEVGGTLRYIPLYESI